MKSRIAVSSFALGVVGVILYLLSGLSSSLSYLFIPSLFFAIISLIAGIVALIKIKANPNLEGRWMAWIGIIIGTIFVVVIIFYFIIIAGI